MHNPISRRGFLIGLVTALGAAAVSCGRQILGQAEARPAATFGVDLPLVTKGAPGNVSTSTPTSTRTSTPIPAVTGTPTGPMTGRVIHVHSPTATSWSGQSNYWDYVSQSEIDAMVNRGLMELTRTSTVADAWRVLIPNYVSGQKIAIKVSFNNTGDCGGSGSAIDGIIEPVNSVVKGLEQIGVARADVWIYDAIRALPDRFVSRGLPGLTYFDGSYKGICRNQAGFASSDRQAYAAFSPPAGVPTPPSEKISDVLINAAYLINMPIMKRHAVGVSLGFKNHFGTINSPGGLHPYTDPSSPTYRTDYSALVDLYRNWHIRSKSILTLGDGLFAAKLWTAAPSVWATFGNQLPKSLFFAVDPVGIDCVMHDLIAAEMTDLTTEANRYLSLAGNAGLGVFERGDPWKSGGYSHIDYRKIELNA